MSDLGDLVPSPTCDQFRAVAREWAEHWGGTVSASAHVRRTKYGAQVSCRSASGSHYYKAVTTDNAIQGYSESDRLQIALTEHSHETFDAWLTESKPQ